METTQNPMVTIPQGEGIKKDGDTATTLPSNLSAIDRAEAIMKSLEEKEKAIDIKTKELNEILTRQILGGKTNAGQNRTPADDRKDKINSEIDKALKAFGLRK